MVSKTRLMLRVEKRLKQPLEELIVALINEEGLRKTAVAKKLGVSKVVLNYWLMKLGIRVQTVALGPRDTLEIKSSLPRR